MEQCYEHLVQYYETDQMGIVHHSNYIRWFEEARLDRLAKCGISCCQLEQEGIIIPVVDVSCKYLVPARYGQSVQICLWLTQYTGVRMGFRYEIFCKQTGDLCCTGTSTHCFVDKDLRPISIRRKHPQLHQILTDLVEAK